MPPPWTYKTSAQQEQNEQRSASHEKPQDRDHKAGNELRRLVRLSYLALALILSSVGWSWEAFGFLAFAAAADVWWWYRQAIESVA